MDDLTLPELVAEFPGWTVWRGIDQLWWARRNSGHHVVPLDLPTSKATYGGVEFVFGPALVRGEDLTDLRDQIRRALADV